MSKDRKDYGAPAKLKDSDIEVVFDLLEEGNTQVEVASLLEVSPTVITNLLQGKGAYSYLRGTERFNNLLTSLRRRKEERAMDQVAEKVGKIFKDKHAVAEKVINLLLDGKSEEATGAALQISIATVQRIRGARDAYEYLVEDQKWIEMDKILGPVKRYKKRKKDSKLSIKKSDSIETSIAKIEQAYDVKIDKMIKLMLEGKRQTEIAEVFGVTQVKVSMAYMAWKKLKVPGSEQTIKDIKAVVATNRATTRQERKDERRKADRRQDTAEAKPEVQEAKPEVKPEEFKITELPAVGESELDEVMESIDMAKWVQMKHRTHYLKWVIKGDLSVRYHLTYTDRKELEGVYILKHHGQCKYTVIDEKFAKVLINDSSLTENYTEVMGHMGKNNDYIKYINHGKGTPWIRRNEARLTANQSTAMTEKFWKRDKNGGFARDIGDAHYHIKVSTEYGTLEDPKFELYITKPDCDPEVHIDEYQEVLKILNNSTDQNQNTLFTPRKALLIANA